MPTICTSNTVCAGGSHFVTTIAGRTIHLTPDEMLAALSNDELDQMFRYIVRHKNTTAGITLAQLLGRCITSDEATNVKIYTFFGPGAAITKTNVGTAYVNICPGLNGERVAVDFRGCTQYRLMLTSNLIGVGQFGARVVRDSDVNDVLHDAPNLGAAGERESDTGWLALPAWALALALVVDDTSIAYLRAQAKSQTSTDDPIFRRLQLGLR